MRRFALFALLLALAFAFSAQAEPYLHPESGIMLPDSLGGLAKGASTDYESRQKGLGASVRYSSNTLKLDVYLYTYGLKSIPDGIEAPLIRKQLEQACSDVVKAGEMGAYQDVVRTDKAEEVQLAPSSKHKILVSNFALSIKGKPFVSKVCVMGCRNHFLKIRCTYSAELSEEAGKSFKKFLEDLAVAIDAQQA